MQEYQKSLGELQGQLDEVEGMGQLLASGCVHDDKEAIMEKINELR